MSASFVDFDNDAVPSAPRALNVPVPTPARTGSADITAFQTSGSNGGLRLINFSGRSQRQKGDQSGSG